MYAEKDVTVVKSTPENLAEQIKKADVFISTILIPRCDAKIGYS